MSTLFKLLVFLIPVLLLRRYVKSEEVSFHVPLLVFDVQLPLSHFVASGEDRGESPLF